MLDARFRDLASKTLSDFGRLGDAPAFRNETRDVRARGQKHAFGQLFDMEPYLRFVVTIQPGRTV
ncbi:MAG: hypothetical protein OXQ31_26990 [Spirochaetaceae bacterium]|nr:hypothetical protein [Spirochaetaceae bacterium]